MWMDHRASEEAIFINSTNHEALKCMGGSNVAGDAASKTFVVEEGTVNFEMTVVNENEEKLDIQYPQH